MIEIDMIVKLFIFPILCSICLAITLEKSTLLKLCETARSARNLGLNNNEAFAAMKYILKDNISTNNSTESCTMSVKLTNNGVLQAVLMLSRYLEESNYELLKASRLSVSNFEQASDSSSSIPISSSEVISSLAYDYCKNIDFPELIDIEDQVVVRKAIIKMISSALKQHENAAQSIKKSLNSVDRKLPSA